ncbi:hypothetical protein [Streptomyces sp. 049-1]|uniref:hypothetical protein n=1 Tax=Streptomyces sp. 049-1 TaxID=2789264 RepID=UPI0039812B8E
MSDEEQSHADWRDEAHRSAQAHANAWAERVNSEYGQAVRHEDDARARQHADNAWQRDRMAEERRLAQFHGVRSTEALKLAEMWAHVARALADGPLPEPLLLASREQPAEHGSLADPGTYHRG